jgi:hypothetical protein
MKGGIYFTESLPINDRRNTHTDTQTDGIYEVAVEMGSGTMIYIPGFIKIGSGIQKLIGGTDRYTDIQTTL